MKTISTRDFLRGGLTQTEPVMVMNYSRPRGIWIPYIDGSLQIPSGGAAAIVERLVQDQPQLPDERTLPPQDRDR